MSTARHRQKRYDTSDCSNTCLKHRPPGATVLLRRDETCCTGSRRGGNVAGTSGTPSGRKAGGDGAAPRRRAAGSKTEGAESSGSATVEGSASVRAFPDRGTDGDGL